jgi:hypothetical protein
MTAFAQSLTSSSGSWSRMVNPVIRSSSCCFVNERPGSGPTASLPESASCFADYGDLVDQAPVPNATGEPIQQLVHADVTFRCQRRDRLRDVLGVVILHRRKLPLNE